MVKARFVVVSKDENSMMKESDFPCESVIVRNNRENLTVVYNRFLKDARDRGDVDFLILMHADVRFDANKLLDHIEECKDKYDVMGLCGCSKISISQHPLNWFCGSRPFPESRWGCVTHGELNNQTSFFSSHSPNVTDHEVACIDGLCIIFGKRAIDDETLRFDENLQWNCYDTGISFECMMNKKGRLGVLVERGLQHYSVGKSILTEAFLRDEDILRNKFRIPLTSSYKHDR